MLLDPTMAWAGRQRWLP